MSRHSRRRVIFIALAIALLAIGIGGVRLREAWALREETQDNNDIQVAIVTPKKNAPEEEIILPGNVEAWHQATIYARTNGYVKQWYTPFGTHVKRGDVMAEIETPEVDAQLRQAEADLKTAEANNELAQITAKRWKALLKTDSVSKQETDEKVGDAKAKDAALASAKANRDHLRELSGFKLIKAPFDGIVSARLLDIGLLVNDANGAAQQALFTVVQQDRLRVYVKVPQNDSARINPSVTAELHFTEHPGEVFKAKYYKSAMALDPSTRTLEIEMVEDNKDGKLFSGGYTEVHLKLPSVQTSYNLPVNTLIFRAKGLQIAVVDDKGNVTLKNVTMGRDYGNTVEISAGLDANDRVVVNPPDSLASGQQVRVMEPKTQPDGKEDKKP